MAADHVGHAIDQLCDISGNAAVDDALHDRAGARGVSSGGLAMIEHPAASAAAIFLHIRLTGKFHGENAATGPTGCFSTNERCPVGRTSTRP